MARTLAELLDHAREFAAIHFPGAALEELGLRFTNARPFRAPVPPAPAPAPAPVTPSGPGPAAEDVWVPTDAQACILEALDGKALRSDALAHRADVDRRTLFRRPGGLQELRDRGLVEHHDRLGYYRPDCPPPELAGGEAT